MLYKSRLAITIKRGTRLRYPIKDANGVLLLAQGAEVTERLAGLLEQRGITLTVWACLKVTKGEPAGLEIPVRKDCLVIGRRPDCDVQLEDLLVSGHHCNLHRRPVGVFLEDLKSRNGTYLNGKKVVEESEVGDQDTIRIGKAIFTVQLFAALEADSEQGSQALIAWHLSVNADGGAPATPYGRTLASIDLDALMG
jgi:hypothetical protein